MFSSIVDRVDAKGRLKKQLIDQFVSVLKEKSPGADCLGSSLAATCRSSFNHFNLREQSELLQILLVYFHQTQGHDDVADFKALADTFQVTFSSEH